MNHDFRFTASHFGSHCMAWRTFRVVRLILSKRATTGIGHRLIIVASHFDALLYLGMDQHAPDPG